MDSGKNDDSVNVIRKTASLCPECLKLLQAEIFERGGKVWIRKECPEHGKFEDLYWGDYEMYKRAEKFAMDGRGVSNPNVKKDGIECPFDCGLCSLHKSHTALGNIAVTNRCDLNCWYCFFFAEKAGYVYEPSLGQIREMLKSLRNEKPVPCNAIQITGGEPSLRKDLLDIIRMAKEEGFEHVQLNTNGIRLSQDPELVRNVRKAGVNTIYLSFDGMTPESNPKNHWEIPNILKNCRDASVGVVLVPTVIKGVNDHEIGEMIRFGFRNIDVVRAVNYQPVSLVGMMPRKERDKHRITIPDTIQNIQDQTDGQILKEDFYPVPTIMPFSRLVEAWLKKPQYELSSHFACGMATYVFQVDGRMLPITRFLDVDGLMEYMKEKTTELEQGKNKYMIGLNMLRKIGSFVDKEKQPKGFSIAKMIFNAIVKHDYNALGKFHEKSLFIGMMHFQDLYNYDIERVKRCCIHYAMPGGKIIPFCTFNVIPQMYRDKGQKEQGINIPEWEKKTGRKLSDELYHRDTKKLESSEEYRKTYGK